MQNLIRFSFNHASDANLAKLARQVVNNCKENEQFTSLKDTIAGVEKDLNEFDVSLANAGGRDRTLVSIKNDKKALLRLSLANLALSVSQVSKGDRSVLLSSGYDVRKERDHSQKKALALKVEFGNSGEAITGIQPIKNIRAYLHQYTNDPLTPDSTWVGETTLQRRHTFKGLAPAAKIWFRVGMLDKTGQWIYLEPVSRIIQ